MHIDDGLEDVRWICGLEGEILHVASYALLPNLKGLLFAMAERDGDFLSSVFYTSASKCVCIRRLAGVRHVPPAVS